MNTTIMCTRPVWAEISRKALLHNFALLRARAGSGVDLLAVVKANAYGHGILECAPLLAGPNATERAEWIGVTCVDEGVKVRAVCPTRVCWLCPGCGGARPKQCSSIA